MLPLDSALSPATSWTTGFPALIKREMITLSPHCPQWFPQSFQLIILSLIGILRFLSALPVVKAKLASFMV